MRERGDRYLRYLLVIASSTRVCADDFIYTHGDRLDDRREVDSQQVSGGMSRTARCTVRCTRTAPEGLGSRVSGTSDSGFQLRVRQRVIEQIAANTRHESLGAFNLLSSVFRGDNVDRVIVGGEPVFEAGSQLG